MGERALADREYPKSLEALTRAKQDVLHVGEREGGLDSTGQMLLSLEISMASAHCGMECSLEAWNACDYAIGVWFQLVRRRRPAYSPRISSERSAGCVVPRRDRCGNYSVG